MSKFRGNFVHVYLEIWDKGILKFNQFNFIKLGFEGIFIT